MKFKILRIQQGFKTAKEFAEAIGFSPQRVSKWETGCAQPKAKDLPKIAAALRVSVETVLNCFVN